MPLQDMEMPQASILMFVPCSERLVLCWMFQRLQSDHDFRFFLHRIVKEILRLGHFILRLAVHNASFSVRCHNRPVSNIGLSRQGRLRLHRRDGFSQAWLLSGRLPARLPQNPRPATVSPVQHLLV